MSVANYATCKDADVVRQSSKMRLAEAAPKLPTEKVARSGFSGSLAFAIDLMQFHVDSRLLAVPYVTGEPHFRTLRTVGGMISLVLEGGKRYTSYRRRQIPVPPEK